MIMLPLCTVEVASPKGLEISFRKGKRNPRAGFRFHR